ncbi:hypothetical protein F5883DRAFT_568692 [Diaporthe sp. PMI_573]|nr:hypothetical protein F5883DRAFT_568692 [Diaporthaceae sp. PMI_573]
MPARCGKLSVTMCLSVCLSVCLSHQAACRRGVYDRGAQRPADQITTTDGGSLKKYLGRPMVAQGWQHRSGHRTAVECLVEIIYLVPNLSRSWLQARR